MTADALAAGMTELDKRRPAMQHAIFSSLIVRKVVINRINTLIEQRKCSGTELLSKSLAQLYVAVDEGETPHETWGSALVDIRGLAQDPQLRIIAPRV